MSLKFSLFGSAHHAEPSVLLRIALFSGLEGGRKMHVPYAGVADHNESAIFCERRGCWRTALANPAEFLVRSGREIRGDTSEQDEAQTDFCADRAACRDLRPGGR